MTNAFEPQLLCVRYQFGQFFGHVAKPVSVGWVDQPDQTGPNIGSLVFVSLPLRTRHGESCRQLVTDPAHFVAVSDTAHRHQ